MKFLAQFISIVFQPLLVPTALLVSIYFLDATLLIPFSYSYFFPFLLIVFLTTYIVPAVLILIFRFFKITDSFTLDSQKDRIVAAILILFLWSFFTYLFETKYGLNKVILNVLLFSCTTLFISSLLNYFYRFSLHTFSYSTIVFFVFFGIYFTNSHSLLYLELATIFLSGLVGWSRLFLQIHTPNQVFFGYSLGGIIGFIGSAFVF